MCRPRLVVVFLGLSAAVGQWAAPLAAAEPYEPRRPDPILDDFRWRDFPDLKNQALRTAAEDADGRIWFGSDDGLLRYDGQVWTAFGTEDGLSGVPINAVLALEDGSVVAASDSGIDIYRGGSWSRLFPLEPIPFPVNTLTAGSDGDFWAGTAWGAVHFEGYMGELIGTSETEAVMAMISPTTRVRALPESVSVQAPWVGGFGLRTAEGEFLGAIRGRQPEVVAAVASGGPADRAGIEVGDLVESTSSLPVTLDAAGNGSSSEALRFLVKKPAFDDTIDVVLGRETIGGEAGVFPVSQVMEDAQGRLWFGLQSGEVFRFQGPGLEGIDDDSRWSRFDESDGLRTGHSPRLMEDRTGVVWYISNDRIGGGVNRYDGAGWSHFRLESLGGSDNSTSIIETDDGAILVGGFGLHIYREGRWSVYSFTDLPIPFHRIRLVKTRAGMVWVVGLGEKAVLFDPGTTRWDGFVGLRFECADGDGNLWFLEEDGSVAARIGEEWIRFAEADGLPPGARNLYSDHQGDVWAVGSEGARSWFGRFDVEASRFEPQDMPEMILESPRANAFFRDSKGSLWFGARNGVIRVDSNGAKRFSPPLAPGQVYAIAETRDGLLWFGGDHLKTFDGRVWRAVTDQEAFSSWIETMLVDRSGALWIGARSYGLYRLRNGEWDVFTEEHGLMENTVRHLGEGVGGDLFAMSRRGLSRFDGERWLPNYLPLALDGSSKTVRFEAVPNGDIWVNAADFRPVRYRPDGFPPDTAIVDAPSVVSQPGNLSIDWSGRDAWENSNQDELFYSWRIDRGDWSAFSPDTRAVLLGLDPGRHTIEVRARDRDFNVDPEPARASFVVLPPVWLQLWFQVLVGVFVVVIGVQASRIYVRDRRLIEAHEHLERRVVERTRELKAAKDEADLASRAKDEFLSVMSHEIRTPLNAILGFADLLSLDDDPKNRAAFLREIAAGGKHLIELVDEVMTFTSLSSSVGLTECEPMDLKALIQSQVEALQDEAEAKGLRLTFELRDPEPPILLGNQNMLRLVFRSLTKNAVKFTERGSITVTLDCEPDGEDQWDARIRFTDTGIGVPEDKIEAIFEPFMQSDYTHTRKYEGVGLGLSLARKIMERLGGTVTCESKVGVGSVFEVRLALRAQPAPV